MVGSTISPNLALSNQDVIAFKLDPSLSYSGTSGGWGWVYGGANQETATSLTLDAAQTFLYISGYSDTPAFSSGDFDMFLIKVLA